MLTAPKSSNDRVLLSTLVLNVHLIRTAQSFLSWLLECVTSATRLVENHHRSSETYVTKQLQSFKIDNLPPITWLIESREKKEKKEKRAPRI